MRINSCLKTIFITSQREAIYQHTTLKHLKPKLSLKDFLYRNQAVTFQSFLWFVKKILVFTLTLEQKGK